MLNMVICGEEKRKSQQKGMQDDKIRYQRFTCCGKQLENFYWEGWDLYDVECIEKNTLKQFKFCPFCGKKIDVL